MEKQVILSKEQQQQLPSTIKSDKDKFLCLVTSKQEQKKAANIKKRGGMIAYLTKSKSLGNIDKFVVSLNWQQQKEICGNAYDCFLGAYPTLAELDKAYGKGASAKWLVPQLNNLSEFCGAREKISENQLSELAQMIPIKYYYLKCSELMIFFFRFKFGEYGNFFGSFDPVKLMEALTKHFLKERISFLDKCKEEVADIKREREKQTDLSYSDYCLRQGITPKKSATLKPVEVVLKRKEYSKEKVLSIARELVDNVNKLTERTLLILKDNFTRRFGTTPELYVDNYK